jgi:ferritin
MHEQTNANIYGVMSNYFDSIGLENCHKWFAHQREEELGHAQKIIDFCTSAGVDLCFESVKAIDLSDMLDPVKLMKHYLDLEIETTESIRLLCKQALVDSDFISFNFLNDFIKDQLSEENEAQTRLQIFYNTKDWIVADHAIGDL